MSYVIVIPNYNHELAIGELVEEIAVFNLPIIIVNDGSRDSCRKLLLNLAEKYNFVTLVEHVNNLGKGAAMQTGLKLAYQLGYSHALQIDADGQHNANDIETLLMVSRKHPNALISGQPIYDESVPKHRFYARYITHVWVWIETLSLDVTDTMCGFRVYPLTSTVKLIDEVSLGKRMDFDTEIMVRLYWRKVKVYFCPTKVDYPEGGVSHFRAFKDNVLISWMHTRLFFGMLARAPVLIFRKFI